MVVFTTRNGPKLKSLGDLFRITTDGERVTVTLRRRILLIDYN